MATAFAPRPPATMTARMVVMMTPEEKRALEARAEAFALTPSELMRRGAARYEPDNDEAILEAFLDEFEANNRAMAATLAATNDRIEATIAEMRALRAAHQAQ